MFIGIKVVEIIVSHHSDMFGGHNHFGSGDIIVFNLSHDLLRTCDQ